MKNSMKIPLVVVLIIIAILLLVSAITVFTGPKASQPGIGLGLIKSETMTYPGEGRGLAVMEMATPQFDQTTAAPAPNISEEELFTEKRIIKNGDVSMKVENAESAATDITQIAAKYEGFVQSSYIYESATGAKSGTVVIRVPEDKFEAALQEIKTVATQVVSENISGQDVTEEYIDLKARLNNKYEEEQQYLKILDRAEEIEDVLMVTERLSRVRGEIEQLEGRIKYLENLTDLATISAYITEEQKIQIPVEKWRPLETLRQAARALIASLQNVADIAIWLVIFVVGLILPIVLIVLAIVAIVKKIRKKKK